MSNTLYTAICSAATLVSNRDGFFQKILDDVTATVGISWINNFKQLQTNRERISHCLTDETIQNQVHQMMNNVQEMYRGKSVTASQSRRLEAEKLIKSGSLDKALIMYTQSIIKAPPTGFDDSVDGGKSLALAFWGRSNILYKLEKFDQCLNDIKFSLKEKLPDTLKLKAYWLMADCYIHLSQFDHAKITYNILIKMAPQISENANTWVRRTQSKLKDLLKTQNQNSFEKIQNKPDIKEKLTDEHLSISNVSSKLNVTRNDYAGNHFIAAERISIGDILIAENPYVSCLSVEKYGTHCQHCLRRLETAFPCPDCSAVAFCSSSCQIASLSTYHKFECHYLDLLIGSGMSILSFAALRIVSQQHIKYFTEFNSKNDESNADYYEQVYNMVSHADKRTAIDFLQRTLMAIFLLAVLKKSDYFKNSKSIDDIDDEDILIGSILLRNLEVLQFNAHEITEPVKLRNTGNIKNWNIGIGLFKSASFFNHGCFPDVTRYYRGRQLIVRAIRTIEKHEIVADNYGPIFTKIKLQDRRRDLSSRYWFECECKPCIENWPTINDTNGNEYLLRCTNCKLSCPATVESPTVSCKKCNSTNDCGYLSQLTHSIKEMVKRRVDDFDDVTISELTKNIDYLDTVLSRPNLIYFQVADKLNQCWANSKIISTI